MFRGTNDLKLNWILVLSQTNPTYTLSIEFSEVDLIAGMICLINFEGLFHDL